MGKGLLLGVGIGFLAGWFVFEFPDASEPLPASRSRGEGVRPSKSGGAPEASGDRDVPAPAALDAEVIRGASIEELRRLPARQGPLEPGAVEAICERLDQARKARDWELFLATLNLLRRAGTERAHGKLIELIGDGTLRFKNAVDFLFLHALRDSKAPGIAEAVRNRIAQIQADGREIEEEKWWLHLLAIHGDTGDLARLDAWLKTPGMRDTVLQAYMDAAGRKEVADRIEALLEGTERGAVLRLLSSYATRNPERAVPLIERELAGAQPREVQSLMRAYGHAVDAERLPAARTYLLNLTDRDQRVQAVDAVQAMHRRGLDVTGLEPLLAAPVEMLEHLAQNPDNAGKESVHAPLYAVEYNRLVWSERAAKALEAAARVYPRKADELKAVARKIRRSLGSPGSDWAGQR